jgi:hypothetical protein
MTWEKEEKDFILKTIISILIQFRHFLKKKYVKYHDSLEKSLSFFENHYKSKTELRESTIEVIFKKEDERLSYYKKGIENMYINKKDFLLPDGTYQQLLKE